MRETRELMLRRVRIGVVLGAAILVAFFAFDYFRLAPERYPHAVLRRALGVAALLPLLALARWPWAVRWAEWLGAAALLILLATTAAIMPLFQGVADPHYAIQGTGMVFCILGAALLLPFDARQMLALGLVGLAFHYAATFDYPFFHNGPILIATAVSIPIAVVGAHELTRGRLAEFEGRRAEESLSLARGDFVAMLTHDIKNPLSAIRGYAQLLQEEPEMDVTERAEMLLRMERAAGNALRLAMNFLDASRIEAGRFALKKTKIELGEVLRGVMAEQGPFAAQKGVRLLGEHGAQLPSIDGDAAALDRLFANLVGNAIKHTPAGGAVRVAARRLAENRVEVVVEDDGAGIEPGQETRIFERYTAAATRADSTGLGLFIARTVAEAHGGTIGAERRTDGPGARFRVTLPGMA